MGVGSRIASEFMKSEQFSRVDASGTDQTLRRGVIGDVADFTVVRVPGLPPDKAYAFHRTAYAISFRAPIVPRGAPWGATRDWNGFAIRVVEAIDPDEVINNFHADVFIGTNTVPDYGAFDEDGLFEPAENPNPNHDTPLFVRAVEISIAAS